LSPKEVLLVVETFVEHCFKRVSADACRVGALRRAIRTELGLLRQEVNGLATKEEKSEEKSAMGAPVGGS
jgi:hypothetical protein